MSHIYNCWKCGKLSVEKPWKSRDFIDLKTDFHRLSTFLLLIEVSSQKNRESFLFRYFKFSSDFFAVWIYSRFFKSASFFQPSDFVIFTTFSLTFATFIYIFLFLCSFVQYYESGVRYGGIFLFVLHHSLISGGAHPYREANREPFSYPSRRGGLSSVSPDRRRGERGTRARFL